MFGKKTTFNAKWLDKNSWSIQLYKLVNFICLESGNPVTIAFAGFGGPTSGFFCFSG